MHPNPAALAAATAVDRASNRVVDSQVVRVLVGEDEPLFRAGIIHVLRQAGLDVVAFTDHADDVVRKARAHRPNVAVLDVRMPPTLSDDGFRAALELRSADPPLPVLLLSQFLDERYAMELLDSGPDGVGYLLKERLAETSSFVHSVEHVAHGGTMIDPEVMAQVLGRRRRPRPIDDLTAREREVLALMAQGSSNDAIAETLVVTLSAVERHITRIFAKLELGHDPDHHKRVTAVLSFLDD
jgi:DNA-binding NarL/FixJ family response regulator